MYSNGFSRTIRVSLGFVHGRMTGTGLVERYEKRLCRNDLRNELLERRFACVYGHVSSCTTLRD